MENKTTPKISKSEFTTDVNNGMSKAELATKWNISTASVKEIASELQLTIKRALAPKYILTDESTTSSQANDTLVESNTALNN